MEYEYTFNMPVMRITTADREHAMRLLKKYHVKPSVKLMGGKHDTSRLARSISCVEKRMRMKDIRRHRVIESAIIKGADIRWC